MQFVTLPEPHISCSHVLTRSPLLYRLDARNDSASMVISECVDRRPNIETNGDPAEARLLFDTALSSLQELRPYDTFIDSMQVPLYTLDLRSWPTQQAMVVGYRRGVKTTSYGLYRVYDWNSELSTVVARLFELREIFYGD